MSHARLLCAGAFVVAAAACGRDAIDRAALTDPASCGGCHPDALREWAGSMHAYASDDPVFLAVERLGQRDTAGALGGLCIGCHAPVAATIGGAAAGHDLAGLPRELRGVTCISCHQIDQITALHNGGLTWSDDGVLRGQLADPVATPAHASAYAALVDGARLESSQACGACHDVALPGVAVERTYGEWSESVFAADAGGLSCTACHMPGRDAPAAYGERTRRIHDHSFPGVDGALEPWPLMDEQRVRIDRDLGSVLAAKLCVRPSGGGVLVDVTLDNSQGGHAFPSGVTHARRAWLELVASEAGAVTFSSGDFGPGDVVRVTDPDAWVLGSRFFDAQGQETGAVWNAAAIESALLPPAVTRDPSDPRFYHAVTRTYAVAGNPDRITIRARIQPIGLDVIDSLIGAGELDPAIRDRIATHDLASTVHEWQRARDGLGCAP